MGIRAFLRLFNEYFLQKIYNVKKRLSTFAIHDIVNLIYKLTSASIWIIFYMYLCYNSFFFFLLNFKFIFLIIWLYIGRIMKKIYQLSDKLEEPTYWIQNIDNKAVKTNQQFTTIFTNTLHIYATSYYCINQAYWSYMILIIPGHYVKLFWLTWVFWQILGSAWVLVPFALLIWKFVIWNLFQLFVMVWIKKFIVWAPFSIFLLILNSIFIFFFKKWLGPVGIFYISISTLLIFIIFNFYTLLYNLKYNVFIYIDMGRWVIINDIIDSHLLFCFDNLTLILSIVVAILTILAQFFGVEYMAREAFVTRLIYLLNLFATSVILLFCVFDFFLILISWECIGLFSFLLVNFYSTRIYTLKAALKTFIFSRISDMFIFISFNICVLIFNTTDLTVLFCKAPFYLFHSIYIFNISINIIFLLTMTLSLAGCIKGAQFFFHVWLPDAMEAPTPASALIHSSTLVIMGVYVIIRFNILFEFSLITNYFLILIGGLTIAFGSVVACFQNDIKKLVAYSTISQMGYLICGCGFCAYNETIIYLIMHACNKAFLFILVGYVVHFFNSNTDLRQMSNLYIYSFDISSLFLLISFNLIGLPYGSGFFSKEFLLFQTLNDGFLNYFIRSMWFVSFCFTPYYMFLLVFSLNFWNIKTLYKVVSTSIFDRSRHYMFRDRILRSPIWSLFTAFLFSIVFFIFNTVGEYFIFIIFNLSSNNTFIIHNVFLNLNINKLLLTSITPDTTLEIIFYFVLIGLYISSKFLIHFLNTNTARLYKLIFYIDVFLILNLILLLLNL